MFVSVSQLGTLNVVMTAGRKFLEIQSTAERQVLRRATPDCQTASNLDRTDLASVSRVP